MATVPLVCHAQHKLKVQWYDVEKTKPHVSYYVLSQRQHIIDSLYQEYFPNRQLKSKGMYKQNKPVGLWEYFHENGNLRMKGEISNFKNNGSWVYYYENGQKFMEGVQHNGLKEGEWITFYDNGKIKSKGVYSKGHPTGNWNYFYEDGIPKAITSYRNGRGLYHEFYKDGSVKMEGLLVDGKSDSTWNYYYENGKLKATGKEVSGLKDGFWKFFHDNGLLSSEGLYLNGVPFGNWRYYHENGALSAEGSHKGGEKDGFWKLYYPTGEFKAETQFKLGEGLYKEYFESGKLKVSGNIRKGLNEGPWVYYYEDGNLEGKCSFTSGIGDFTGYYPNGIIKMEGRIEDGVKTGVWKLYKPHGELAGFYRTYYENKETVFVPLEDPQDTLKTARLPLAKEQEDEKKDTVSANKKTSETKLVPRRHRNSRIRYFRPKLNEYKALILSTNPFAPIVVAQLPVYLEYMIEERLGFGLIFTYYSTPFFKSKYNIAEQDIYNSGSSIELMQRFYHPTNNLGSLYFGHSIRYTNMTYGSFYSDTLTAEITPFHYRMKQTSFEYALVGGNRIFLNGRSDKPGFTLDFYVGLLIGTRKIAYDTDNGYYPIEEVFRDIPRASVYGFGKLGVSVGYIF